MDKEYRARLLKELDGLKECVEGGAREAGPEWEAEVEARIDALEAVLDERSPAAALLSNVRSEILRWEVEHPKVTALLQRVSSALEGVGL